MDYVEIVNLVAGASYTVERTITGVPSGDPLTKAWLTIKAKDTDLDPGLVQLAITSSITAAGQITDTGADGTGVVVFTLTPAQTALLTPRVRYAFDCRVKTVAGVLDNPFGGVIIPQQPVTLATT